MWPWIKLYTESNKVASYNLKPYIAIATAIPATLLKHNITYGLTIYLAS